MPVCIILIFIELITLFTIADPDAACNATENCVNTEGSYECECIDGFRRDIVDEFGVWQNLNGEGVYCIDMDECRITG